MGNLKAFIKKSTLKLSIKFSINDVYNIKMFLTDVKKIQIQKIKYKKIVGIFNIKMIFFGHVNGNSKHTYFLKVYLN